MEHFLIYIGKAAVGAGAFYLAFLMLFQNQKHFVFNRIYLPVTMVLSFIIPLVTFTTVKYIEPANFSTASIAYLADTTAETAAESAFVMEWYHYLLGIYFLGIFGFLVHLLLGHFKAIQIIRKSRKKELFETPVNITQKDVHPFSFFSKIVLSEKTLSSKNLEMIVCHENIHVKEKHTLDILFTEILFMLQWFNPFAWLIKDAVKNNLEYKTDDQVTQHFNPQNYQMAMVALADKKGVAPFLTALNGSQLKNRIIMMKKKTKNKFGLVKQLIVLPLLAVLVMGLSSREVKTEILNTPVKENTPLDDLAVIIDGEEIQTDSEPLNLLDFSKGFSGQEVIEALKLDENKVQLSLFYIDKNTDDVKFVIRTSDYTPGSNPEFDKMTETTQEEKLPIKKTLYAVNGELISKSEIDKPEDFNSATVFSGKEAIEKFGHVAQNATVIDFSVSEADTNSYAKAKYSVSGKVSDKNGNPIPGASVLVKGAAVGTITNPEGIYQLKLEEKNATLVFWMIDYQKKEIQVSDKSEINVELLPDEDIKLQNILIPEYTSQQKGEKAGSEEVFYNVDERPQFAGGENALRKYISHSIKYPETAIQKGIEGKVYITFIVTKNGEVMDPKVTKGIAPSLNEEALRVINNLPNWKPGKKNGKKVNTYHTVPVEFKPTLEQIQKYRKVGWEGKPLNNYNFTISGRVTDEKGNAIRGAAVLLKGKTVGTLSDTNGNYQLKTNSKNETLIFSMVGYQTKEVSFEGNTDMDVQLFSEQKGKKDEIKVTGYRKNSAGIKIKGSHFDGEPAYIVDGEKKDNIDYLNPEDIKSISVLKGKTAAALYGDKNNVKNGVILIETKSNKAFDSTDKTIVVDGKKFDGDINDIPVDDIANISILKGETASQEIYAENAKNGVVIVNTKTKFYSDLNNDNKPYIVVDGEEYGEPMSNITPESIKAVNVLKGEAATELYGKKAQSGAISITTKKNEVITTPLQLRKFIANSIRYPVEAHEKGQYGTVVVNVKIKNKTWKEVQATKSSKQRVDLDEIVAIGYAPEKQVEPAKGFEYSASFVKEVQRVIQLNPLIDIPEFEGKTLRITVRFMLQ
ncbi:TonB family protein [Maribellus maritimus]|uniref:TonB family protein n=1 Tax=Maribellus maritimus TaxID=2870838 RepID=UPI001EEC53A5|nr:TonB family protein [Maribellus maritimus]MCG6188974.1 TonB family protein [Maribellus maritimus]